MRGILLLRHNLAYSWLIQRLRQKVIQVSFKVGPGPSAVRSLPFFFPCSSLCLRGWALQAAAHSFPIPPVEIMTYWKVGWRERSRYFFPPLFTQATALVEVHLLFSLAPSTSLAVVPASISRRPQAWAAVISPLLSVLQLRGVGNPLLLVISAFPYYILWFLRFSIIWVTDSLLKISWFQMPRVASVPTIGPWMIPGLCAGTYKKTASSEEDLDGGSAPWRSTLWWGRQTMWAITLLVAV